MPVGTNDAGIEVAWSFLKENWEEIERSFGNQVLFCSGIARDKSITSSIVLGISSWRLAVLWKGQLPTFQRKDK